MSNYHFFEALSRQQVIDAFPEWNPDFANKAFDNWLRLFAHKSNLLYTAQYYLHNEEVGREFCKMFEVDDYEAIHEFYPDEWREFREQQGINAHFEMVEAKRRWGENVHRKFYGTDMMVVTASEIMEKYLARLQSSEPWPDDDWVEMSIMRLWFNTEINNSTEEAKRLKYLPYPEYLKSEHWRRIRSAMLLVHGARCQGDKCQGLDSYWLGGESLVHVHHVTYKNRGNERFEDLRLLCEDCHKRYHDTKTSQTTEYVDDLYRSWSNPE